MPRTSPLLPGDPDVGISHWTRTPARVRHAVNAVFIGSIIWLPAVLLLVLGLWTGDMTAVFEKWRIAGLAWIVAGGSAFLAAWLIEFRGAMIAAAQRKQELISIESRQHALQTLGDESEEMVDAVIREVAPKLDPQYCATRGMVVRYPSSRPDQMPMFEVDNLLITRFGIFLIEVKHWKGRIDVSDNGWSVVKPGKVEGKQSPLKQSEPKARVLRAIAREVFGDCSPAKVHSLAVFTHPTVELPLTVPAEVLFLQELRYYLRTTYLSTLESGLASLEVVQRFRDKLGELHNSNPDAKHEFMLELARKKGTNSEYLDLELRKQQLQRFPGLYPRPYWASPVMYIGVALYLGAAAVMCRPQADITLAISRSSNAAPGSAASMQRPDSRSLTTAKTGQ